MNNNEPRSKCCAKFHEEGIETGINFINVVCDCKCHTPKSELSKCCGARKIDVFHGKDVMFSGCSACGKPFVAEEGEEVQANFMQVGDTHCFGCHKTFPPEERNHLITCGGEIKPCKWNGKECYPAPQKEEEDWEYTFNKFFPEMCSVYGLKNIPRGVYADIKSFISSLLKEREEKARAAEKAEIIEGVRKSILFNNANSERILQDIINFLTSK